MLVRAKGVKPSLRELLKTMSPEARSVRLPGALRGPKRKVERSQSLRVVVEAEPSVRFPERLMISAPGTRVREDASSGRAEERRLRMEE